MKKSLTIVFLIVLCSFLYFCKKIEKENFKNDSKKKDSISLWILSSKNKSYTLEKKKDFLLKSYQTIKSSHLDSIQTRNLSTISYQYLKLKDTFLFKKLNKETIVLATKMKDSFALGDAHWNFATYYNTIESYQNAYYHFNVANLCFEKSGSLKEAAISQYGMAFIKGRFKDYSGSEVLTFKAIRKFKQLKNYRYLFLCYNHLAGLQDDIKEYDKALIYYKTALTYVEKRVDKQKLYRALFNNIGNTYIKKGEYHEAIEYFNKILENKDLKKKHIESYARTSANKAYSKLLLKDTAHVLETLKISLQIRNGLHNKTSILNSKIYLSKYYAFVKDTINGMLFAKEANTLAKEVKNGRDYLESLSLLAELDSENSKKYLQKHIQFSDSLQIVDRKNQNKFTRIAYQTDEYIAENKHLTTQKKRILIISFTTLLIIILSFVIYRQNAENEKLLLENAQQKANEKIYLLTLKQQERLEEEKIKERVRISEDLHDGILGKLFGTRLGLGFLEIKGDETTTQQYQKFLEELQTIEQEIREVSHKLNDNFDSSQVDYKLIITQLIKNKSVLGAFKYQLKTDDAINWQALNKIIKINLYCILQEATQNIVKYALAKNVSIQFYIENSELLLTITDDGRGFDTRKSKKGIGLKNIKSRVEKLNGKFYLHSTIEKGTKISIQIPL